MIQERMYSANEYAEARDRILTLEAEVERLNKVILGWVNENACTTTNHKHELAEYRAIITKLGRRLGCMRKRRKQELAERVMSTTYRCTHCGVRSQSEEALREHCRTCPKHPARAEVEQLKAELVDWREASRRIMAEECAPDEKHCTCVPALREEIERLRTVIAAQPSGEPFVDALDDADAEVKRLKGILKERQAEIRTHQAEVKRLKNQAAHYSKAMWDIDREKNGYAEQVEQLQAMIPTKPEGAERLFWLMKPVLAKPFTLEEED